MEFPSVFSGLSARVMKITPPGGSTREKDSEKRLIYRRQKREKNNPLGGLYRQQNADIIGHSLDIRSPFDPCCNRTGSE